MEFSINEKSRRERRSSFWRYLPGFSRKVKEKDLPSETDVTLISANKFYNSFRSLTCKKNKQLSEKAKNSIICEPNSENLHGKDAGILFLTSDNQLRWRCAEEAIKEKHVQFAPTPLNKYHTYSNVPKIGKENICPSGYPASSIMKHHADSSSPYTKRFSASITNIGLNNKDAMNDFETFTLARTSTRSNLAKQADVTLPNFDISAINDGIVAVRDNHSEKLIAPAIKKSMAGGDVAATVPFETDNNIGIPFVPQMRQMSIENVQLRPLKSSGQSQSTEFLKSADINKIYRSCYPKKHEGDCCKLSHESLGKKSMYDKTAWNRHSISSQGLFCGQDSNRILSKENSSSHRASLPSVKMPEKTCHSHQHFIDSQIQKSTPQALESPSVFHRTQSLRVKTVDRHHEIGKHTYVRDNAQFGDSNGDCFIPAFGNNYRSKSFRRRKSEKFESHSYRPVTSSPNHHRSNPTLKERNHDGMSSAADDECSFNCSCLNCDDDTQKVKYKQPSKVKYSRSRLFFPEQTLPTILSPRAIVKKNNEVKCTKQPWYNCNDSMCQSPLIPEVQNENLLPKVETIYANENILISEDYDIQQQSTSDVPFNDQPFELEPREDFKTNDAVHQENVTVERRTTNQNEQTAHSDILSESCALALQETLKDILKNNTKSTLTISRLNSNTAEESQDTFVIHIQKEPKASEQSNASTTETSVISLKTAVNSNGKNSSLSRSLSLPELNTKEISEIDASSADLDKSSMDKELEIEEKRADCIDNEELKTDSRFSSDAWNKTPSIASNSGYSTVSSTLSVHQVSNCSEVVNETEILETLIRQGMRLPPIKNKKKTTVSVSSPRKSKFKAKDVLSGKAQLKLNIYHNFGMVTVHVIKAVKLSSVRTVTLNPYVKVMLHPDESRRAHWRTNVAHGESNPVFNQKFSFEIVPDDATKRLIFSVWHRDKEKKRSEFLGCMSFGLHHVMESDKSLSGWYRFLKEVVGTKKHFAAGRGNTLSNLLAH